MNEFVRRRFPLAGGEWLECWVRIITTSQGTTIIFRECRSLTGNGALATRFEYVANHFRIELLMRGIPQPFRFIHERPAWTNGTVSRPASLREVRMTERDGLYHYADWVPLAPEDVAQFSAP